MAKSVRKALQKREGSPITTDGILGSKTTYLEDREQENCTLRKDSQEGDDGTNIQSQILHVNRR